MAPGVAWLQGNSALATGPVADAAAGRGDALYGGAAHRVGGAVRAEGGVCWDNDGLRNA
jgi:hypothetical protein